MEEGTPTGSWEWEASASEEEIQLAYYTLIKQYHPDQVHHLGREIQEVARAKTREINWAYGQIKNN